MRTTASDIQENLGTFLLVTMGFLLTSTGYLAWVYRLVDLTSAQTTDLMSMVVGYMLQAAGISFVAELRRRDVLGANRRTFAVFAGLFVLTLVPALLAPQVGMAIAGGLCSNLLCGGIAALYLERLTTDVDASHRALVFGGAYAVSSVTTWLLSLVACNVALRLPIAALGICAALAGGTILAARNTCERAERAPLDDAREADPSKDASTTGESLLALAGATVVLLSLVKNAGFGFSSADMDAGASLELSRIFYALGLVAAGVASDRNRRYGAACCIAALVLPFAMLALSRETTPVMVLWCLDYLLFGFFSVYRVVLLSDMAEHTNRLHWAGFGLMYGRLGDALGTALCNALSGRFAWLVLATMGLFALTVFLFLRLYQHLYLPQPEPEPSEHELFERFAAQYDLSARERDVLRLILAERTNTEIAAELYVSESTVKFHVHNLLKKIGCKSRLEILAKYALQGQAARA